MEGLTAPACPSLTCCFNKGKSQGTNSSDVWVMDALFCIYLCFDWFCRFDLEWFSRARKFWNVRLLMTVWSSWGDLVWSLSHEGKWTVNYWLVPLPPSPLLPPSPNTHTHPQPVRWRAVTSLWCDSRWRASWRLSLAEILTFVDLEAELLWRKWVWVFSLPGHWGPSSELLRLSCLCSAVSERVCCRGLVSGSAVLWRQAV